MSVGLIALLDDIAAIAKVAAASVDDVAAQAAKAGAKAAGVVIDDAAVTPRYVVGFQPDRELPIVWSLAKGSLRNKLLILTPAALALSAFAPWVITPLLMLGGAYLCYEGAEKLYGALTGHGHAEADASAPSGDAAALEKQRVAGAIKTDFILSAEIMAITLATMPEVGFWTRAIVLALVGIVITAAVYGVVALIVKADDAGVAMAASPRSAVGRAIGRGLVKGMPYFLKVLAIVGTVAMLWVGGGIIVHGLETYGMPAIGHLIHDLAAAAAAVTPEKLHGAVAWLVSAAGYGLVGLAVGLALIPFASFIFMPIAKAVKGRAADSAPA